MTGHGQALVQNDQVQVLAEVRTVNNRFLKINISSGLDAQHETQLEALVKKYVTRGSVNLRLNSAFLKSTNDYKLNLDVLRGYAKQMLELNAQPNYESLLLLPGVIAENSDEGAADELWPVAKDAVEQALKALSEMRSREGAAMGRDLESNCDTIAAQVEEIHKLSPRVAENYSKRITDRINVMLEKYKVSVEPSDLIREVGIFADRCDISEELVRLRSHIQQFREILSGDKSNGRKLDFLTQELLRETNTIGSKANDSDIANHVVEIKTAIERIREMVQNVE